MPSIGFLKNITHRIKCGLKSKTVSDTPDNPKPFHLNEGDTAGFSDGGQAVPVTWPGDDERELPPEVRLVLALEAGGCVDSKSLLEKIRPILGEMMDTRAAEFLRHITLKLGQTAAGLAFQRVLSMDSRPLARTGKGIRGIARCPCQARKKHLKTLGFGGG
jgi:hypothetical protein